MVTIRSEREIDKMRASGRIVVTVFKELAQAIKPGVSTQQLNEIVEASIVKSGAIPLFKGYRGFPAASCISINEEVVHGIPSRKRILKDGDIVSIDVGVRYAGYCGDAAVTFPVGNVSGKAAKIMKACRTALMQGIAQVRPGGLLSKVCAAIESYATSQGYKVVRRFVGHGIGTEMHEPPHVPNYVDEEVLSNDVLLQTGMVLAIEPMLNEGTHQVKELKDKWTVVTTDRKLSAHFEQTVAVGPEGPEIMTPWHEEIDSVLI